MSMIKGIQIGYDKDGQYGSRKEGGSELANIEGSVDKMFWRLHKKRAKKDWLQQPETTQITQWSTEE